MENHLFSIQSLFSKKLTYIVDFFEKFTENSLFTVSMKDIKTRKICLSNKKCAEVWGLGEVGLVGMSSRDCLEQVTGFVDRENVLKRFEAEEATAISNNCTQTKTIAILDYDGFVRIRQHLTIPVCGIRNQLVAITAICTDLTSHTNFLHLFKLYQKYYVKSKAIAQLSKYLKLDNYFQFKLTAMELSTLLAMVEDPRHKQVAHLLTDFRQRPITSTTISNYVDSMKDKLKINIDIHMVLSNLRSHYQWMLKPII